MVTYLAGLLLVGITVVPLLFVFLDGARATRRSTRRPPGCRIPGPGTTTPGCSARPRSGSRWPTARRSPCWSPRWSWCSARWPRSRCPGTRSGAGRRCSGVRGRPAVAAQRGRAAAVPAAGASSACWTTCSAWRSRGGLLAAAHRGHPAPVHAAIPARLEDAAVVDGASRLKFFLAHPAAAVPAGPGHRRPCWRSSPAGTSTCCRCSCSPAPSTTRCRWAWPPSRPSTPRTRRSIFAFTALSMVPALGFFMLRPAASGRRLHRCGQGLISAEGGAQ